MKVILCPCGKHILVDDDKFDQLKNQIFLCEEKILRVWLPEQKIKVNIGKLVIDVPEGFLPDHIDGDVHDNRRCNLRVASYSQNAMNKKTRRDSSSGYKGVFKNGNGWIARIRFGENQINLGTFKDKRDAAHAYNVAAKKFFGEFARLNDVEGGSQ